MKTINHSARLFFITVTLLLIIGPCADSFGSDGLENANVGVDYAFLSLMTLSPDFAAANYTIDNDNGTSVDVTIGRLPYHIELTQNEDSSILLEVSLAYQFARQFYPTFSLPGENIDSKWDTYGAGLGVLYEKRLTPHLLLIPSLRYGVARMENHAEFNGELTNQLIKGLLDGTFLNWRAYTSVLNLGVGFDYHWELLGRPSSIVANVYHTMVDSFSESNEAVKFRESANMMALKADMVFPTPLAIKAHRIDLVLLLGANHFFGENSHTLGYTTSYQSGLGAELPIDYREKRYGFVRFSGQVLWADNMQGWILTVGYTPQ